MEENLIISILTESISTDEDKSHDHVVKVGIGSRVTRESQVASASHIIRDLKQNKAKYFVQVQPSDEKIYVSVAECPQCQQDIIYTNVPAGEEGNLYKLPEIPAKYLR